MVEPAPRVRTLALLLAALAGVVAVDAAPRLQQATSPHASMPSASTSTSGAARNR